MAKKKKASTSTTATYVSYKDVMVAYLLDGLSGTERLLAGHRHPRPLLQRAAKELKEQGRNVDALEVAIGKDVRGRGRTLPAVGEERQYKGQQIDDGGVWVRLPLNTLGIKKADLVHVRFEGDRIVVSRG